MNEEITYRPKKGKTFLLLLTSTLFVAAGFFIMEKKPPVAWMCIVFFGLGVVVFTLQLLPNCSYLKLEQGGFTVRSLFRSHFYSWADVKDFRVGYAGQHKMVLFNFSAGHKKAPLGKQLARLLSGSEAGIPEVYHVSHREIVEVLNEWQAKFLESEEWMK